MNAWKLILGALISGSATLGVTGYGILTQDTIIAIIGTVSTLGVAFIGSWPALRRITIAKEEALAGHLTKEREALHNERLAIIAALHEEIDRLKTVIAELEKRLAKCEETNAALADKIRAYRQGILSDTDLEIAQLLRGRQRIKGDEEN